MKDMVERFTREQKILADCMKLLIDLYYVAKENYNLKIWWKPASVELLKRLFYTTYGNCEFNEEIREFEIVLRHKKYTFYINSKDRDKMISILSNLDAEISDKISYHFDLLGVENTSINKFDDMRRHDKKMKALVYIDPIIMTLETQQDLCLLKDKAIKILRRNNKHNTIKLRVISADFNKVIVNVPFGEWEKIPRLQAKIMSTCSSRFLRSFPLAKSWEQSRGKHRESC